MIFIRCLLFVASILSFRLAKGQDCDGELVDDIYNIDIELSDISKNCNETDFNELGKLLQVVISEADELVPQFEDEFMYTTICEEPEEVDMTLERRLIRIDSSHRGLGRYALKYLGGGVCRRCKQDSYDRRILRQESALRNGGFSMSTIGMARKTTEEALEPRKLKKAKEAKSAGTSTIEKELEPQARSENDVMAMDLCKTVDEFESKVKSINKIVSDALDLFQIMDKIMNIGGENDADLMDKFVDAKEHHKILKDAEGLVEEAADIPMNSRLCKDLSDEARKTLKLILHAAELVDEAASNLEEISTPFFEIGQKYQRAHICKLSETAVLGTRDTEAANAKVSELNAQLLELVLDLDDEDDGDDYIKDAKKLTGKCERHVTDARKAVESARNLCEDAPTKLPGEELHKSVKQAEKEYKEAIESGKDARKIFYETKELVVDLKREIYDEDHKTEMENLSLVSDELSAIDADIAAADATIDELEKKMKREKNESNKKKMDKEVEKLKKDKKKLEEDKKEMEKKAKDKLEWKKDVAHKTFDVETARSADEWNKRFEDMLKEYIPRRMLYGYGLPGGLGCLDEEPKVEVEVVPLEDSNDMNSIEQCKT